MGTVFEDALDIQQVFAALGGTAGIVARGPDLTLQHVFHAGNGQFDPEQIKKLARKAADSPAVQQAAGAAQAQAAGLARSARDKVTGKIQERLPKLAETAKEERNTDSSSLSQGWLFAAPWETKSWF